MLRVSQLDFAMIGKVAVDEVEAVHDFAAGAAAKQSLAVARKCQTVEGLVDFGARNDLRFGDVEDEHFVWAVARMKDRGVFAIGMNRDVDGKITHYQVLAG